MKNELMLVSHGLVTTDHVPDLTDATLDQLTLREHEEGEQARMLMENFNHQVVCAVHIESSKHPIMMQEIHRLKNRLQQLAGLPPSPDSMNPLTNRSQELEEASVVDNDQESEDTQPDRYTASLKSQCKDLYRQLTKLTHPDRTEDPNLRELFPTVKQAMKTLDLNLLQQLLESVQTYKKSRKNREDFRKMKLQALRNKQMAKEHYRTELQNMRNSMVGNIVLSPEQHRSQAFLMYIEVVRNNLQMEIQKLDAMQRMHRASAQRTTYHSYGTTDTTSYGKSGTSNFNF